MSTKFNLAGARAIALAGAACVALSCVADGRGSEVDLRVADLDARFHLRLSSPAQEDIGHRARVDLPPRASDPVKLEDEQSHVAVQFSLQGVQNAPIQTRRNLALYAAALDGADLVHLVHAAGTEDFVLFEKRPVREALEYVVDVSRVAGLRLVSNTLEFLDHGGAPRLRVAPPYVVDAFAQRHEARLTVEGCAYDTDPAGPWAREVTKPGAASCTLRVSWSSDVVYPAVVDPAWTTTGSMAAARFFHVAALLGSGKVLVAGGTSTGAGDWTKSAELYDPGAGTFAATGSMATARGLYTGTLLASGKVLVVGGRNAPGTDNAELYNPATGTFEATGATIGSLSNHTASLLGSGKVLVAGGNGALTTAQLYDPATGDFTATGPMGTGRGEHTASVLPSGEVLVAGGSGAGSPSHAIASAELYDPTSGTFSDTTTPMGTARRYHTASVLRSGKVLISGGGDSYPLEATAELYDPTLGTFSPTGSMLDPAGRAIHSASVLPSGNVLVFGGIRSGGADPVPVAELYDPIAGTFASAGVTVTVSRWRHTATVLESGQVLIAGGRTNLAFVSIADLYGVAPGTACTVADDCSSELCADGFCCATACDSAATCMTCAPKTGACVAVTAADDPNTCTGTRTCDATGACKLKDGEACTGNTECAGWCNGGTCDSKRSLGSGCSSAGACASDFCADGVCCNAACTGACEACDGVVVGTCSLVEGAPHGTRPACPASLECGGKSKDCEPVPVPPPNASTSCDGDHTTKGADGTTLDCTPYKCKDDGSCRAECSSANDCVAPAVCGTTRKCVPAPSEANAGGCEVSPSNRNDTRWCVALGMMLVGLIRARRRRAQPRARRAWSTK
jgi:hypothetical protein